MTKTSTFHEIVLKNVDTGNPVTGLEVGHIIASEAQRRLHLRGKIESIQWDRERGIGILVDDAGVRDHLANALDLDTHGKPETFRFSNLGTGHSRSGVVGGFQVRIWNLEV